MLFKEDWDRCKTRFDAFWEGEIEDRCCIAVYAPRNKPIDSKKELMEARDFMEKWTDSELRLNNGLYEMSRTFYGGEATPRFWDNMGPGVLSAFIGSPAVFGEDTVWFDTDPIIRDWSNKPGIRFDENNRMWKIVWDMMEYFLKNAKDKFLVGMADLGGSLDIAATLRGTEILLYDLVDNPDEVRILLEEIDRVWTTCLTSRVLTV